VQLVVNFRPITQQTTKAIKQSFIFSPDDYRKKVVYASKIAGTNSKSSYVIPIKDLLIRHLERSLAPTDNRKGD